MELLLRNPSLWRPQHPKLVVKDIILTLLKANIVTIADDLKALACLKWVRELGCTRYFHN